MENSKPIKISVTEEEYKIILEALLFSVSTDVSCDWYADDLIKIKDFLIKLRATNKVIPLDGVSIINVKNDIYYDEYTPELAKYFPETVKNFEP